jgi:DNA-binding protein HU-beta
MRINKKEIVTRVASRSAYTKKEVDAIVTVFLNEIGEAMKANDSVMLVDFGHFVPSIRKPRKGRNPSTGEIVDIASKKTVGFKVGNKLKKELNE